MGKVWAQLVSLVLFFSTVLRIRAVFLLFEREVPAQAFDLLGGSIQGRAWAFQGNWLATVGD